MLKQLLVCGVLCLAFISGGKAQKAKAGKSVTLSGQVVCSGCWDEADRTTTGYGTEADMACAASCAGRGVPAALAVKAAWASPKFTLYRLEAGKFNSEKNWLKFMAKRVEIKGRTRQAKGINYLKVDSLTVLEASAAHSRDKTSELVLRDLEGKEQRLSGLRGKVVVLNFWAQWCGPCRREMEILQQLAVKYKKDEVEFIAASLDEPHDFELVKNFVRDTELKLKVWVGATKADKYRFGFPSAIPSTAVINRKGQVVWRYNSVVREDELKKAIDSWLRSK